MKLTNIEAVEFDCVAWLEGLADRSSTRDAQFTRLIAGQLRAAIAAHKWMSHE